MQGSERQATGKAIVKWSPGLGAGHRSWRFTSYRGSGYCSFQAHEMALGEIQAEACLERGSALISIFFGSAAAEMGAVISSIPLRYSAESLSLSTPSGSRMLRWNEP